MVSEQQPEPTGREAALLQRVQKRAEVKADIIKARKARDKALAAYERYRTQTRLRKAQGELGGFICVASDGPGRNAELDEYLCSDEAWLKLVAAVDDARDHLETLENELSGIDFAQRERAAEQQHQLGRRFSEAIEGFGRHVKVFTEAVGLLLEVRGR